MRVRLLTAALLVVLTGTGAEADPCPAVTDASHDQLVGGGVASPPAGAPEAPALDVVSADLGFVGDDVVGVVRLRDLGGGAGPFGTTDWVVAFTEQGGERFELFARREPAGTSFDLYHVVTQPTMFTSRVTVGPATGTVDTAADEVRIAAPRAALSGWLHDGEPLLVTAVTYGGGSPANAPVVVRMDTSEAGHAVVGSAGCLG